MSQKTMTEKDALLAHFEREYQITLRELKAYPADKSEMKPAEKSRNARELAWMMALNQGVVVPTLAGDLKPGSMPGAPKTWNEILPAFEKMHRESVAKLEAASEEQLNRTLKMMVGPGKTEDWRIADALWFFFHDAIHHRGQFSVYQRIVGAKVPSIYGPSADEPWS